MSDNLADLNGTFEAVWERLESGPRDPLSAANLLVLATQSPNGAASRLIVLRQVNRVNNLLRFFTHAASDKVAELRANNRAELLIWDAGIRFQIRLQVVVEIAPVSPEVWSKLGNGGQLNYAVAPLPGTPISAPEIAWAATPVMEQMMQLDASILRIETLHVAPDGLRRAVFENGSSRWVAP